MIERLINGVNNIGPLLADSGDVRPNMAESVRAVLRAEGPRDFLFELDHADFPLGQIVVEGDAKIMYEGEDFGFVPSVQQIFGW